HCPATLRGISMNEHDLIERFETCTLSPESFPHREHVRLAWLYLRRYPVLEALSKFCEGLKRFAGSLGKADRYHETITWAYLLLIRERMVRTEAAESWVEFAEANADLLDWEANILKRYYQDETLRSDLAKQVFVFPDKTASTPR